MRLIEADRSPAWLVAALVLAHLASSSPLQVEDRMGEQDLRTATLVMVRHGQSIWNKDNRFTSWVDVPLSDEGLQDAHKAGKLCFDHKFQFDVAFTSVLQRAVKTCYMILENANQLWIPVHCRWRLNERHDGALTGLNKKVAALDFGRERVQKFRRGYTYPPPPLNKSHPCWPGHDPKYVNSWKDDPIDNGSTLNLT
eukprot:754390-Hanusia_phi.AAC.1